MPQVIEQSMFLFPPVLGGERGKRRDEMRDGLDSQADGRTRREGKSPYCPGGCFKIPRTDEKKGKCGLSWLLFYPTSTFL